MANTAFSISNLLNKSNSISKTAIVDSNVVNVEREKVSLDKQLSDDSKSTSETKENTVSSNTSNLDLSFSKSII